MLSKRRAALFSLFWEYSMKCNLTNARNKLNKNQNQFGANVHVCWWCFRSFPSFRWLTLLFFSYFFWLISSRCSLLFGLFCDWFLCILLSVSCVNRVFEMRVQHTLSCECSGCVNIRPFPKHRTNFLHGCCGCCSSLNKVQCQRHRSFAFFISVRSLARLIIDQKHQIGNKGIKRSTLCQHYALFCFINSQRISMLRDMMNIARCQKVNFVGTFRMMSRESCGEVTEICKCAFFGISNIGILAHYFSN